MLELIKREVHNSRTLRLLVLRDFVNLIMISAIKRVPKFSLKHFFLQILLWPLFGLHTAAM